MTIRRTFELVTGAYLVVATALGVVTGYLFFNQQYLRQVERARLDSNLLADELRQSSSELPLLARLFVATGDEDYRQRYNDLLALRAGDQAESENYARLYWYIVANKPEAPLVALSADLLRQMFARLDVGADVFAQLDQAGASSDSAVSIELAAMHTARGEMADGAGGFTKTGEPDPVKAAAALSDSTYNRLKTGATQPLDDFVAQIEDRATAAIARYQGRADLCFRLGGALVALLLALTLVSLDTYRQRISAPVVKLQGQTRGVAGDIDRLADTTRAISEGDLSRSFATTTPRLDMKTRDEVADLARLHDSMISRLQETGGSIARVTAERHDDNLKLAELNNQKNEFLGMAAHDLRNPLAVFLGFTELMLDGKIGKLSAEQEQVIAVLKRDSDFMLGLVDNLLDVAKIESGKVNLDLTPVDLGALAEENVAFNRLLAEKHDVKLALRRPIDLPTLTVDRPKIWQVFNNLLSNAVKFSRPGTMTTMELTRVAGGVTIEVRDQGAGIPPNEMESLFKPFSRGKTKPVEGERSTGLGLVIVKKIVESHGGTIKVESKVGAGSTFTVFLPESGPVISAA
ncbi:MAG TPA: HAMP domain-containing sensor histidine kinase [bacterium]|nr:HAMP domain-containing sensor histidine kinase [bacterium]